MARACLLAILFVLAPCGWARAADAHDWFSATRAFEEGRYEDVLEALDQVPATDKSRYLRALTLARLHQAKAALEVMSEAPEGFPEGVRADFEVLRAEWAAEAGDCPRLTSWSSALPRRRAARLNAECAFFAGELARARDELADAKDVAGRALLLKALVGLDDPSAKTLARALWIEAPAHRDAASWQALALDHGKRPLTFEEHLARADAWLDARQFNAAAAELEHLDPPKNKKLAARFFHTLGKALYRTRHRYDEAAKAFAKAASLGGEEEAYDAFHAVRARSRAGHNKSAIQGYGAFARRYPRSSYAPDALYLAAWLRSREGQKSARRALESFATSKQAKASPELLRKTLWELVWLAFDEKKPRLALRWLDKMPDTRNEMERARVRYWQGRSFALSSMRDKARAAFRETLTLDPLGWYAQLAARKLFELEGSWPAPFAEETTSLRAQELEVPDDVRFYRELGLTEEAGEAADRWTKRLGDRLTRVAAYAEAGNAEKSHVAALPWLSRLLAAPISPETRWLWEAAFPRPYQGVVRRETKEHVLPDALFYGHMQVESRYRPRVVSGADAIGLMQLLPSTARRVAEGTEHEATRDALRRPYVNIALGASYLGALVRRYGRRFPAAIAAYNAGGLRIDGWLERESLPLDRWVEAIPIDQTRNYVRRVVTAWARYHYMSHPEAPWDLPLPEKMGGR